MQPEKIVTLLGGLSIGGLCGLIPFFVGRKKNRASMGVVGLNACMVSGVFFGVLLALPVAIVFTIVIVFLSRKASGPPPILPQAPPSSMNTSWQFMPPNEKIQGPISERDLRSLVASGDLRPNDMVRREGMTDWTPLHANPELFGTTAALDVPTPNSDKPKKPGFFDGSLGCIFFALAMMLGAVIFAAIKRFLIQ